MRYATRDFDEVMENVRSMLQRGSGRNLTASIRYNWDEWSALIGRGRPFSARDAADALGVPTRSIHTAMSRVARRPPESREDKSEKRGSTSQSEGRGWIEQSPHYRQGDTADYTQGQIVRRDRDFGEVRIDPETGNADYALR